MGAKIQAFDIFQAPLSSHYPLPLMQIKIKHSHVKIKNMSGLEQAICAIIFFWSTAEPPMPVINIKK